MQTVGALPYGAGAADMASHNGELVGRPRRSRKLDIPWLGTKTPWSKSYKASNYDDEDDAETVNILEVKPWTGEVNSGSTQNLQTYNFLHITDIHADPYYLANSDPQSLCHRRGFNMGSSSHYFGNRGSECDSPYSLVNGTFDYLKRVFSSETNFVLWTGDSSRHDRDNQLRRQPGEAEVEIGQIVDYFTTSFNVSLIPVIPSIGNWDIHPANALAAGPNGNLDRLYGVFEPLLRTGNPEEEADIAETFKKGGYFVRSISPNVLDVISVNTLYFFSGNEAVRDCIDFSRSGDLKTILRKSNHPGDMQLLWLVEQLESARARGSRVILSGHVPPRSDSGDLFTENCLKWWGQISGDFADVIMAQYFGHINRDLVTYVTTHRNTTATSDDANDVTRKKYDLVTLTPKSLDDLDLSAISIVSAIFTSPSIVPVYNPGFKFGTVVVQDAEAEYLSYVKEHSQYFVDVEKANRLHDRPGLVPFPEYEPLDFNRVCSTQDTLAIESLSPSSWEDWIRRLQTKSRVSRNLLGTYWACSEVNISRFGHGQQSPPINPVLMGILMVGSTGVIIFLIIGTLSKVSQWDWNASPNNSIPQNYDEQIARAAKEGRVLLSRGEGQPLIAAPNAAAGQYGSVGSSNGSDKGKGKARGALVGLPTTAAVENWPIFAQQLKRKQEMEKYIAEQREKGVVIPSSPGGSYILPQASPPMPKHSTRIPDGSEQY
ncbi:Metallo-dependent phosphatase-like protein [Cladochytrium replicatum]|nr:Metallo-dependent phosphatase-like protein [Cladochytrium replicatum]